MQLEDFKKEITNEDYDKVYEVIVKKDIELINKIGKIKNIDVQVDDEDDLATRLYHYYAIFREESGMFKYIKYVVFKLQKYEYEGIDEYDTPLERIKTYINDYNNLQELINTYEEEKNNLKNKSIIDIRKEYKDKFINLFKEMLDYKNISYKQDISFSELITKVYPSYYFFADDFKNIENAIENGYIQDDSGDEDYYINKDEDPVEVAHYLSSIYKSIKDNNYYQTVAYLYHEIPLKEKETYEDIYNQEKLKIVNIFKEMLDYKNIAYNDKDNYSSLLNKVANTYPYLNDVLRGLDFNYQDKEYITIIDRMKDIEEALLKRYKNYEQEMLEYQKKLKDDWDDEDFLE